MIELYYWPTIMGRGEYPRLVLVEAGQPWREVARERGVEAVLALYQGKVQPPFPVLAPPILKDGDFVMNQSAAICRYLGRRFDLWPSTPEDEAHADQVSECIADFLYEVTDAYHPVDRHATYVSQQAAADQAVAKWVEARLPRFLRFFERALEVAAQGKGAQDEIYVVSDRITYVDLMLMQLTMAAEFQFPSAVAALDLRWLPRHRAQIAARPRVAAYLRSPLRIPFEGNSCM
ncbi:glutathione S-transferase [Myxococcota bacterium]|nr:glutathione S-transferase [Myxococcota bacterium]MBU1432846.1 glutathione S-transferase [Myxococcota bacterium]MBU1897530.1 glutathione S-transferase [Myxococcota bacterium]